jgi:uncharacterized glyoxalase superfamily protein PhnB
MSSIEEAPLPLNINMTFDGDCREAFEFYRSVLGGAFAAFHSFSGGSAPSTWCDTFGIN